MSTSLVRESDEVSGQCCRYLIERRRALKASIGLPLERRSPGRGIPPRHERLLLSVDRLLQRSRRTDPSSRPSFPDTQRCCLRHPASSGQCVHCRLEKERGGGGVAPPRGWIHARGGRLKLGRVTGPSSLGQGGGLHGWEGASASPPPEGLAVSGASTPASDGEKPLVCRVMGTPRAALHDTWLADPSRLWHDDN